MNYKWVTLFIFVLAIGLQISVAINSTSKIDNYLYLGQHSLKNHLITADDTTKEKIIFLGSSAVSGNNIPKNSTLTDYFNQLTPGYSAYNLAALQNTLLDANILLNIHKDKNIKIAILGIDPSILVENQSSTFAKVHARDADSELQNKMNHFLKISLNDQIDIKTHQDPLPPNSMQINWRSLLYKLRINFWGPLFNKKLYGEDQNKLKLINSESNPSWWLIVSFIKTAKKNNIQPIILIEPTLASAYSKDDFDEFQKKIREKTESVKGIFLNYSSMLPSSHDYFYDFVHLTPMGNHALALKLKNDLVEKNIIREGL